jgi:hypothetical protein
MVCRTGLAHTVAYLNGNALFGVLLPGLSGPCSGNLVWRVGLLVADVPESYLNHRA